MSKKIVQICNDQEPIDNHQLDALNTWTNAPIGLLEATNAKTIFSPCPASLSNYRRLLFLAGDTPGFAEPKAINATRSHLASFTRPSRLFLQAAFDRRPGDVPANERSGMTLGIPSIRSVRKATAPAVRRQNAIATSFAPSISVVCGPPGIEALADRLGGIDVNSDRRLVDHRQSRAGQRDGCSLPSSVDGGAHFHRRKRSAVTGEPKEAKGSDSRCGPTAHFAWSKHRLTGFQRNSPFNSPPTPTFWALRGPSAGSSQSTTADRSAGRLEGSVCLRRRGAR